jgi:Phage T4 tail fibre
LHLYKNPTPILRLETGLNPGRYMEFLYDGSNDLARINWVSQGGEDRYFALQYNGSTKMVVTPSGKIGIGTSSPGSPLEVNGEVASQFAYGRFTAKDNSGIVRAQIGNSSSGIAFLNVNDGSGNAVVDLQSSGNSYIIGGNVGIGTTNPGSYKLAVKGKIGAQEVVVTQSGWSDFVFKDDYKLRPIDQVAEYVKKNKHLEGIPTEAEVNKYGVSVGDMQKKLLQKLEETTLYLIQMKKENDELKAKVCALEKAIKEK